MKITTALAVAMLLSALGMGTAAAQDSTAKDEGGIPGEFSANVSLVSEYFFRGVSQTDDKPAIQGGFDYALPLDGGLSAYAGVWGSNVDFNDGNEANIETDLYGGLNGTLPGGIGWDLGVIYYAYPGADSSLDYNYVEVKGALSYDFGVASATGSIYYSPEFFANSGDAVYYALDVDVPVGGIVTLSGHVGHQDIQHNAAFGLPDYTDFSVGVSATVIGFDVGVTYTDTDMKKSECDDACGMVLFSVSRSF